MNETNCRKLKVLTGNHKTAEVSIYENYSYVIGSDESCDIILTDLLINKRHLTLKISGNKILILKKSGDIIVDGKKIENELINIKEKQVVTIGEAQFAIGSKKTEWAKIDRDYQKKIADTASSNDLDLEDKEVKLSTGNYEKRNLKVITKRAINIFLRIDRKIVTGYFIFLIMFSILCIDFLHSGTKTSKIVEKDNGKIENKINNKGILLSANALIMKLKALSLIGSGIHEPYLPIVTKKKQKLDPLKKIKEYLIGSWQNALTEKIINKTEVQYFGYTQSRKMNLAIKIKKENNGIYIVRGHIDKKEQRKELYTALGDIVRIDVISAESINELASKVMKKEKIKDIKSSFNIERNTVSLDGYTENIDAIKVITKVLSKTFQNLKINNKIQYRPEGLKIAGVNLSDTKYVKLHDGTKIFKGGSHENGCIIENIEKDVVKLNCQGFEVLYALGDKI